MMSSYSANRDKTFWSSPGKRYAGHGVMIFSMPQKGYGWGMGEELVLVSG